MASFGLMTALSSAATNSVVTTDLSTWDLSQTRTAGHQEITSLGLRVWTDDNSGQAKAAGYYDADDFDLENASDWELLWSGSSPAPGGQLVVDLNNDGTVDGILVIEDAYGGVGGNLWLPSLYGADSYNAGLVASLPQVPGGGGPNNGSLATWNDNFPDAKVLAIGYSLGSGILGDGVISRITVNDTDYTFELAPVVNAENFNTHSGTDYKGINVGFNIENFGEVTDVEVSLYAGDMLLATNTDNQALLDLINVNGVTQLSTPFIIQNGTYVEAYWNLGEFDWSYNTPQPTRAVVTVTGENGTDSVELTSLSEATATYESLLPEPVVLGSKDECKNGGWATSEDPVFKNQGQCVSHFASNGVSTAARNKNR